MSFAHYRFFSQLKNVLYFQELVKALDKFLAVIGLNRPDLLENKTYPYRSAECPYNQEIEPWQKAIPDTYVPFVACFLPNYESGIKGQNIHAIEPLFVDSREI